MIKFEDKELEQAVLRGESCIVIPFDVFVPYTGEVEILTYSMFEETAKELENDVKARKTDVINWLNSHIRQKVKKLGYLYFKHDYEVMQEYKMDSLNKIILSSNDAVVRISDNSILQKLCKNSDCDIEIDGGDDILYAAIVDGKIVSYAGINDLDRGENEVEISVETSPDYFCKGYGSACVASLTTELLKRGISVNYKTSSINIPSIKLAEKCGFDHIGTRYSYYCEKV